MQLKITLLSVTGLLAVTCSAAPAEAQTTKACNRDNCFRQLIQSPQVVGDFCATYTQTVNTVAAALPTFVSQCQGLASRVSSACSCLHPATTSSVASTTVASASVTTTASSLSLGSSSVSITATPSFTTSTVATSPTPEPKNWLKFSTVQGIFLQDDEATNPTGFDYVCELSTVKLI